MSDGKNEVIIPIGSIHLKGNLIIPEGATALVIFSHGSGSSRFSPRNTFVATQLNRVSIATLLIDLLTPQEDEVYENRFDIGLLTSRLVEVTQHVRQMPLLRLCAIGYFGASTGAASALNAASMLPGIISAVVSRGGRPDLAEQQLPQVKAPTLLIVGSRDEPVIEMNQAAYNLLVCEKKLVIVEGATHLFEEEGKLEEVAGLAAGWFQKFLTEHKNRTQKPDSHDIY